MLCGYNDTLFLHVSRALPGEHQSFLYFCMLDAEKFTKGCQEASSHYTDLHGELDGVVSMSSGVFLFLLLLDGDCPHRCSTFHCAMLKTAVAGKHSERAHAKLVVGLNSAQGRPFTMMSSWILGLLNSNVCLTSAVWEVEVLCLPCYPT